ncbi:MAG: hypothetical protein ABIQ31_01730 [Ferruginibacter sp.]
MKKFKTLDVFISIALIIGFSVYSLVSQGRNFLSGYFVVGGWQVTSMLVHVYNKCFTRKTGSRYYYHWITLISVVTMPVGSFLLLLFIAPFMAVYYTYLCYREVYVKMQRPLAMLK